MPVDILLEIHVHSDKVAALKATLREMLVETRVHEGCLSVQVVQNQDDAGNFVLLQQWRSRRDYEAYNAWRAATGAAQAASEKLAATYETRYFDAVEV